ncbi:MAG TPA: hypothetical protein VF943_08315 [Burkholderiales bacterium]
MDFRLVAVILGVVLPIGLPVAAPFLPQHDGQVLERLPARRDDPAMAELRQLRERLAAAPGNAEAAAALAQRYFELASADGDPRYVGYAEAALRPWKDGDAPAEVAFARALVRQYRHDFAGALADLERTLALDPEHVEARAWRAAIFMVQADYPAAARECVALDGRASELLATGCAAYVEATTGDARGAYRRLAEALRRATAAGPYARLWTLTRLAEMATRLSDDAGAERHFRDALALGITDNFVLAAYADFLLAHRRAAEVVALLKDWERSDTLLLRLALAEQSLGLPAAARHSQALGERFAAAALRGEKLHLAEEARYLLDLKKDPAAALAAAAENWKSQREPRDALVLLEAAAAARAPAAAAPALRWLDATRFEDEHLRSVAARLK